MTQAVFRCSNAQGHVIDGRVANVDDLVEAREYATRVAGSRRTALLSPWEVTEPQRHLKRKHPESLYACLTARGFFPLPAR
jgi:hypothetical protein